MASDLDGLVADAIGLCAGILRLPCATGVEEGSCLVRALMRLPNRQGRVKPGQDAPTTKAPPASLCVRCRAYWHVSAALAVLTDRLRAEQMAAWDADHGTC